MEHGTSRPAVPEWSSSIKENERDQLDSSLRGNFGKLISLHCFPLFSLRHHDCYGTRLKWNNEESCPSRHNARISDSVAEISLLFLLLFLPPSHNDPLTPLVNANYINYPERNPPSDPLSCSTLALSISLFQVEHGRGTSSAGHLESTGFVSY